MKQLMMKDFIMQKSQVFLTIALVIGLIIIWYASGTQLELIYLFSGLVISLSLITGGISYDDGNDATLFLLTLPVERKTIVISKYMTGFLTVILGTFLTLTLVGILNIVIGSISSPPWTVILGSLMGNLIATALIFAMYFKFGYENIKYMIVGFILLAVIGSVLYIQTNMLDTILKSAYHFSESTLVLIAAIVTLLIYIGSLLFSAQVMKRKEY